MISVGVRQGPPIKGSGDPLDTSRASCAKTGLDFLTDHNSNPIGRYHKPEKFEAQLTVCGSCPIRVDCLETAVAEKRTYGIWGGTMPRNRRKP